MGMNQGKTRKAHEYRAEDELTGRPDDGPANGYELSNEDYDLVTKVRMFWDEARLTQSEERYEMALDEDFYDGLQWSDEDMQTLKNRGQAPLVINEIKPTIDWIVGTEKRTRIDHRVLPRKNKKEHVVAATAKTQLLKYVRDVSYGPMENSEAFKDQVVAGIGWTEIGIRGSDLENPIFIRQEDWRNIWYDYRSRSKHLDDCRYVIRAKWIDLDVAMAIFPDKVNELMAASVSAMSRQDDDGEFLRSNTDTTVEGNPITQSPVFSDDWNIIDNKRQIVRIVECWYREPSTDSVVRGGYYDGVLEENADTDSLSYDVDAGDSTISDNIGMRVKFAIFTGSIILNSGNSPFHHNRFPFIPTFCYRKKRNGAPYSVVRNLRGVQEDLNKRRSKALHILSTNRVIADADAASHEGWTNIEEELARADGIIKLDGRKDARFDVESDKALAREHIDLMEQDKVAIREIGGVTGENLGHDTNAQSGKAILAKQNEGSVVTAEVFDNYRFSQQLQGEIILSLIEQYYTEEKSIRIAGARGKYTHTTINKVDSDGNYVNDITVAKSDFVISEQDYRESLRMSMFEQLSELITKLDPEVAFNLLDLVIDMSDLPDKMELVERIRDLNGQKAPADDTSADIEDREPPTQEELDEQAAEEQQSAIEQAAQELEIRQNEADVGKTEADTRLTDAKTGTEIAKTGESEARTRRTDSDAGVSKQAHSVDMAEKLGLIKGRQEKKPK